MKDDVLQLLTSTTGDFSHLFSIIILLHKMKKSSVCCMVVLQRERIPNRHIERVRHLVQVAIPLPDCLPYTIR
jgi:hypothetical protein